MQYTRSVRGQGGDNVMEGEVVDGEESVVRLLLEKAGDVNATGRYYGSALQATSYWGHKSTSFYYKIKTKNNRPSILLFHKATKCSGCLCRLGTDFKNILQNSIPQGKPSGDDEPWVRMSHLLVNNNDPVDGRWMQYQADLPKLELTYWSLLFESRINRYRLGQILKHES